MQATAAALRAHTTRNHVQRALLQPPTVLCMCMCMLAALAQTLRAGANEGQARGYSLTLCSTLPGALIALI